MPGLSRPDQSAVFAKVQGRSKQEAVDDSENKDSSADSDRLDATSEMHWKTLNCSEAKTGLVMSHNYGQAKPDKHQTTI